MDQLHAMRVFIKALDEGSLSGAGRRLGRSPAAISRAIAFLEAHVGAQLLHRTTRTLKLSEAGERYAAACRRVLAELEEADMLAAGESAAPRGMLTISAPVVSGARTLRPILEAFLEEHPTVKARLLMFDRLVNLLEEGVDVALRIAHLPDSSLKAIRVGEVRRMICASPAYLASRPPITQLSDLSTHACIAMTVFGQDVWTFHTAKDRVNPQAIHIAPRLVVNTVEAAVASALEDRGLTRVFSYQVANELRAGRLVEVLPGVDVATSPVHLLTLEGRLSVPKVRAFVDFAVPRLKAEFSRLARL